MRLKLSSDDKELEVILFDVNLRLGSAFLFFALTALMVPESSRAASGAFDSGQVIAIHGCPQVFVVADGPMFSIVETVGGQQAVDRDIVSGDVEHIGITTLINTSRNDEQINVIVLDSLLSDTQYRQDLTRYCH